MPIIYTYPIKTDPVNNDLVLISDSEENKMTKQVTLGNLKSFTGGVTQIIAGNNVTISSTGPSGTGDVTINSDVVNYTAVVPIRIGFTNPNEITIDQVSTIKDGYLTSTKFSEFDAKVDSVSATSPLTITGTAKAPIIGLPAASATSNGYLTSSDWIAFNNDDVGVTDVSASIDGDAYSVSVTNPTTTPSIAITANGNTTQYIRGDGSLATYSPGGQVNNPTITLTAGTGLTGGGSFTLNQAASANITFNSTSTGGGNVEILDEGTSLTTQVASIDFEGDGVTATSPSTNAVTVSIPTHTSAVTYTSDQTVTSEIPHIEPTDSDNIRTDNSLLTYTWGKTQNTTDDFKFHVGNRVLLQAQNKSAVLESRAFTQSGNDNFPGTLSLVTGRGTIAAPAIGGSGDVIGIINFRSYGQFNTDELPFTATRIRSVATEDHTNYEHRGGDLRFAVTRNDYDFQDNTPNGLTDRMFLHNTGNLEVLNTQNYTRYPKYNLPLGISGGGAPSQPTCSGDINFDGEVYGGNLSVIIECPNQDIVLSNFKIGAVYTLFMKLVQDGALTPGSLGNFSYVKENGDPGTILFDTGVPGADPQLDDWAVMEFRRVPFVQGLDSAAPTIAIQDFILCNWVGKAYN